MANVSSSNTTTLYSTTQATVIQPGAAVSAGQVSDSNFTTLYTEGQQVSPNNNFVVPGTLTVNGCAILTNCTAFNLLPTTATSINFGNEATALSIGSGSGTTLINNQLATANYTFPVADGTAGQVLVTDGAGTLSFSAVTSVGKTYDIDATSTSGGANLNLNSNVPTTDTVKFSNGTGVTVSQINSSEIGIAIGQDVATTASPTFAGGTFGNITVAVLDDNTITTTTGDLKLTADSASTVILTSDSATAPVYAVRTIAANNNAARALTLRVDCTGTPVVGFGTALEYEVESAPGTFKRAASITTVMTDDTVGSEDFEFKFRLMQDGATQGDRMRLFSNGTLNTYYVTNATNTGSSVLNLYSTSTGTPAAGFGSAMTFVLEDTSSQYKAACQLLTDYTDVTLNAERSNFSIGLLDGSGNTATKLNLDSNGLLVVAGGLRINGSTSGYSKFTSAAASANIDYVLPAAQGAANTVLTNDGSGNLSWALPGGGGSTFGNVSIGVVTDNTISTTTGDLDITSNTGVINLDTYTAFTDNRLTTTSVSTVTLDSVAIATYQSASYSITVKDNVTNATQFTKIDLLHDGSVAYINQYSNMASAADLSTFSATISGANAVLQITPASTNSTQFTFNRIATKV